jgi:GNAT superfamily N-acetyltransferase
MRARDFITELFRPGQDINFKWSRPYKDEVNVLGKTPQGHELSINFWEITDDIVAIDFTIDADVEQDPDPDSSPKSGHELTRHGEEFAVFTQVVNAITQYLNKLPKNNVFFQVKRTEAQREPLYLKIANRVAKQLGFRHGTAQELEVTNPGLYNKFDNRYSKLLWYTNSPQGVAEEIQGIAQGDNNDTAISLSKLGKFHPGADTLADFVPERATAQYALHPDKWESTFYSLTNKDSDKLKYYGPKKISIPPGTLVGDMAIANKFYRAKTSEEKQQYAELYRQSLKPYPVDVSAYRMPELLIPRQGIAENFADGRKFVEPNFDFEWEEAERYPEFVKLGKDAWIELAQKGKAVTINSAQGINNTDAADPDSFKLLAPEKQKRALAQLEKGTVEMPIVAVYSDGHKELIGGNTRLTAMMARDGRATIWAFRVPGKQGVAEGNEINREVEDLVQQVNFVDIVYKIARQKYPQAKFEKLDDLRIQVDIPEENNDPFDYENYQGFFVMGMTYSNDEGTEVGVLINDAYTGPYKGIIAPAIKLATEKCLQLVPNATPTLWVDADESGGIWNEIAKKLGYKFEILNEGKQGVAEGQDDNGISFQVQKGKNKFATTLSIGNKPVGVYQYDADTGRSIAEVYPEFKGKGLGKLLVLHAIYTAAQLGLDFQEDESRTAEYDNVLDSLSSNGYIVDDDGYWYVTGEGEQYLQQSMKQGVAEGERNTTPTVGINVRSDGDIDYAGLIVDGRKKYESRKTDSLGPYVGKTVGIVRTGTGPAVAIGQVTVGEPIVVDAEKFNSLRKQHLVPQGSKFDIDVDGIKYLYPMIDPVRWDNERLIKHRGIVSRKIQEQDVAENFKDGKNPGRKGLSKRMGVNTKASVSALRKVAKNSSGEKQRMAHWLANMKSGRKKS